MAHVSVLARISKSSGTAPTTIAVAHPDLLAAFDAVEDGVGMEDVELGEAVFAPIALADMAAQDVGHQLLAVADTEHREPGGQAEPDRWWGSGS